MRLVTVLALVVIFAVGLCQPATPQIQKKKKPESNKYLLPVKPPPPPANSVTIIRGLKHYNGYIMKGNQIIVENDYGRVIMDGWIRRTGAVELSSKINDDYYVGRVNPMGNGLLMSPDTGDTVRIEVVR
jgi:hypothetical protein